jgi:hypothetical protein
MPLVVPRQGGKLPLYLIIYPSAHVWIYDGNLLQEPHSLIHDFWLDG